MMSLGISVSRVSRRCRASVTHSRKVATFTPPASLSIDDVKREVGEIGGGSVDFSVIGDGLAEV